MMSEDPKVPLNLFSSQFLKCCLEWPCYTPANTNLLPNPLIMEKSEQEMVKCNQRLTVNLFKTVAWLTMDVHYNIPVFQLVVRQVFSVILHFLNICNQVFVMSS